MNVKFVIIGILQVNLIGEKVLVVGDIAGNYNTFLKLIKQVPEDEVIVSVGDMIDRGPRSRQVLEWFFYESMTGRAQAIMGNHEHMFLDWYDRTFTRRQYKPIYDAGLWEYYNGGFQTLVSFYKNNMLQIPKKFVEYIRDLPLYLEFSDVVITHAPINPVFGYKRAAELPPLSPNSLLWNRGNTQPLSDGKFQIHGHSGRKGIEWKKKRILTEPYGICVDTSRSENPCVLSAIQWPSKKIFQEEIID